MIFCEMSNYRVMDVLAKSRKIHEKLRDHLGKSPAPENITKLNTPSRDIETANAEPIILFPAREKGQASQS